MVTFFLTGFMGSLHCLSLLFFLLSVFSFLFAFSGFLFFFCDFLNLISLYPILFYFFIISYCQVRLACTFTSLVIEIQFFPILISLKFRSGTYQEVKSLSFLDAHEYHGA